jgi:pyruvate dehydrogenase E2 component (dihydrolipoamide acetyltransferase)
MPVDVIMPKMEMSQETGQVIEWLKKEGEWVEKGEALLSIETDKVTVEVESPASGFLAGIQAQAGETVPVSTVIAHLLARGETLSPLDPAAAPQPLVPVTPLARRMAEANQIDLRAVVGTGPAGKVTKADIAGTLASGSHSPLPSAPEANEPAAKIRATPAARELARKQGLALDGIPGSGPRGRIQAADVESFPSSQRQPLPGPLNRDEEVIPFEGIRRTIAERLQHSYQTAPHITFTARVDVSQLNALRQNLNAYADVRGEDNASLTAWMVKITAWALVRNPWINSSLRGEAITLYHHAHVGIAVALKTGLIVPVIRDADGKGIAQIAREAKDLTDRARQSKLTPADVAGGTFTLSNLGPFGIEQFSAILNPGQTGILAIGAAQPEPVVVDGAVAVRPVIHLTLSVDHRVVDGAVAAHFMRDLCQTMEQPGLVMW